MHERGRGSSIGGLFLLARFPSFVAGGSSNDGNNSSDSLGSSSSSSPTEPPPPPPPSHAALPADGSDATACRDAVEGEGPLSGFVFASAADRAAHVQRAAEVARLVEGCRLGEGESKERYVCIYICIYMCAHVYICVCARALSPSVCLRVA